MTQELRILTPQGMLGYGVPAEHFWRGIESGVDAMIVDSGSTDPGPYLLGLGKTIVTREASVAIKLPCNVTIEVTSASPSWIAALVSELSRST